jgi:hypothetical protein
MRSQLLVYWLGHLLMSGNATSPRRNSTASRELSGECIGWDELRRKVLISVCPSVPYRPSRGRPRKKNDESSSNAETGKALVGITMNGSRCRGSERDRMLHDPIIHCANVFRCLERQEDYSKMLFSGEREFSKSIDWCAVSVPSEIAKI